MVVDLWRASRAQGLQNLSVEMGMDGFCCEFIHGLTSWDIRRITLVGDLQGLPIHGRTQLVVARASSAF